MRLEHLLSGENDCLLVMLVILVILEILEILGLNKPSASLLPKFINIEKDEAER